MKKEIFENVTSITGKIWRGNKEPTDKTTPEFKFNDSSKYIRNFSLEQKDILSQFPECLAGYKPIATNTGLICFYKQNTDETTYTLVIYDLLEETKLGENNLTLTSISPDISPMLSYDHIKTPMNVRQLNFKEEKNEEGNSVAKFIADHKYTYNDNGNEITCCLYNCDKINNEIANSNGYFKNIADSVPKVEFKYKPLFVIRAFNNDGSSYKQEIKYKFKNKETEEEKNLINKGDGIYYADISNQSSTDYFTLIAPSGSGYLEVL